MSNLIISGGRNWTPFKGSDKIVDRIVKEHGITCILNGGATGADEWAIRYAEASGLDCIVFKAAWNTLGLAAGPMRNRELALDCDPSTDGIILFKGGKGTASMKREAIRAGLPIWYEEV